ncbi:MAG: hypothetical protein M1819_007277 [Sarea resinae]|nr:MAG: hypothetical protein M1819_007277 [Sarea resinae]
MNENIPWSIIAGAIALFLTSCLTVPSISNIYKILSAVKSQASRATHELYEDEDGSATEDTESAYSVKIPKIVIYSWLQVGIWTLLVLQAAYFSLERDFVKRFNHAIVGFISCVLLVILICVENGTFYSKIFSMTRVYRIHIALEAAQLVAGIFLSLAYAWIPRRPDVFSDGRIVDRQYTVSILDRYTFAWPEHLLSYAKANQGLDFRDLPAMDHDVKAENLHSSFNPTENGRKLYTLIVLAYIVTFTWQWCLTLILTIAQFGPQLSMYNILKLLEARDRGETIALEGWFWVLSLGMFIIVQVWVEAWLFWMQCGQLAVPVRQQLSALIFMKAMRRKEVQGVPNKAPEKQASSDDIRVNQQSGPKGEDNVASQGDNDQFSKTRQNTINLIGVDTKRVSEFCIINHLFPYTIFKLAISLVFLQKLIGWRPLLAGLVVTSISMPLNIYVTKIYSTSQDELMKVRDVKMGVVTEALQGIRQIKFTALERQWQEKISQCREKELRTQWRVFMADTVLISCYIFGPIMLSAASLATYALLYGGLSPSIAFTTLSVFAQIEFSLAALPELTTDLLDAWVSVERIEKFFRSPEKVDVTVPGPTVSFEGVSVCWPSDNDSPDPDRFVLKGLNLEFPKNELSIISGKTGSGKSLLLASILGEADLLSGVLRVPSRPLCNDRHDSKATRDNWIIDSAIAFVAQIPWIENATIKNNILFGLPYDDVRYQQVLSACSLQKDLEMLEDGELTEIGANGINLSGGQRWRLSLARALYSRAGILILDDIFSAVDAHVGRHIFEKGLTGELGQGRTRILVTHHVGLCIPKAAYTVLLGPQGTVEHAGLVEDLKRTGSLSRILDQELSLSDEQSSIGEESSDEESLDPNSASTFTETGVESLSGVVENGPKEIQKTTAKKFVDDESREIGRVKWNVYREFLRASGGTWFWTFAMMTSIGYEGSILARSWWVKLWTDVKTDEVLVSWVITRLRVQDMVAQISASNGSLGYYLGMYVGISGFVCIVGTFRYYWIFRGSIKASRLLFNKLTYTVLRAPLRWLDTVPVGRILNRFTADFNTVDSNIAYQISSLMYNALLVLGVIIAGFFISPLMIVIGLCLLAICLLLARQYLTGAREIKRLESTAKSPIFEHFGTAITGVSSLRAFDKTDDYIKRMFALLDNHASSNWYIWCFNRWLGIRLGVTGALFSIVVSAVIVLTKGVDAALAGFALSFALDYTKAVTWTLRQYAQLELSMNSTERIIEYCGLATEDQSGEDAPAAWPAEGRLEVDDLVVSYAEDLPPVLKGVTFAVEKNQRVGVIGRTGAGKSSLTLALFRFLQARQGSIFIDGIDISKLKLSDVRSRLAIIPQDPVLFSGTVRSNLDPFDEHQDYELHDALKRVHLVQAQNSDSPSTAAGQPKVNINVFESLLSPISEGGLNLSQGQRQLLCLARAIVSRPKIMLLDEATSAVDMTTDALIQTSIREEFTNSTLLVIAHRLSTVVDFDRILVMSDGRVVEYDEPRKLFAAKGEFWHMVQESGEKEKLEEVMFGAPAAEPGQS